MIDLILCSLVGAVFLVSIQTKVASFDAYSQWASGTRLPFLRLASKHLVLPSEIGVVAVLVWGSTSGRGAELACLAGVSGFVLALSSRRLLGDCACFGRLSLEGKMQPPLAFAIPTVVAVATTLLFDPGGQPEPGAMATTMAWASSGIAATLFAAHATLPRAPTQHALVEAPPDAALVLGVLAPMLERTDFNPQLPIVVLFIAGDCVACHEITDPFMRFAKAFPGSASYHVHASAAVALELPCNVRRLEAMAPETLGALNVRMFPSAILVLNGESAGSRQFLGPVGIRTLLGLLAR